MMEGPQKEYVLPFQEREEASFAEAIVGAKCVLERLEAGGLAAHELSRVQGACNLMFEAHKDQQRPDGAPYVNHPVLVARILIEKFGITDPNAVVTALIHDVPEDNAERVNQILGGGEPVSCRQATGQSIELLSESFGANPGEVRAALRMVTNPDFSLMVAGLKDEAWGDSSLSSPGRDLLAQGLEERWQGSQKFDLYWQIRNSTYSEIRNLLYLGHWSELLRANAIGRAVKLADFYANGLHRHLLLQAIQKLPENSHERKQGILFCEEIGKKYAPVLLLVERKLAEAADSGIPLVNPKADAILRKRIAAVRPFYATFW